MVTGAGGVACWGDFPVNENSETTTPVPVAGLESGVIDVAVGETHACALFSTGVVDCWGNPRGEYNNAGPNWPAAPTPVPLGSPATAITSGDGFSCAIVAGGQIECWGSNMHQELGSRAVSDGVTPVPVMGLPAAAVGVWADQATSPCALLKDGGVWCWGVVPSMANDTTFLQGSPPVPQTGFAAPVQALTTGGELGMACALLTTGAVQCWGRGLNCLGDGTATPPGGAGCCRSTCEPSLEYSPHPVNVLPSGSGVIEIRLGDDQACALLANGSLTCWGGFAPTPASVPGF
jgi:hypothetical protein